VVYLGVFVSRWPFGERIREVPQPFKMAELRGRERKELRGKK